MDHADVGIYRESPGAAGYRRRRENGFSGWTASGFDVDPCRLEEMASSGRIVKDRPKTLAAVSGKFFIKILRHHTLWRALRYNFRRPRPLRTLAGALRLASLGVATPKVLAALRQRRGALVRRDILVTAALPDDTVFLDRFVRESAPGAVQTAAEAAVALLAKIHGGGFEHGDLSLRNFFIASAAAPMRLGLIDLDGCRLGRCPTAKGRRRRELARLASSFLREERAKTSDASPDPREYGARFAASYRKHTGIDLAGTRLDRKIAFLANRVRTQKR